MYEIDFEGMPVNIKVPKEMNGMCDFIPNKIWFTLREGCELKGINYKTACNRPEYQPNNGIGENVGGRKMFRRDCLIPWLFETNER